ncbi:MFS transporter [Verminephrobacter aporrectodeae subsp. tuberculatae]|uniref:multidrug effflux MFS transporter n=1 Tax=Verminephrobacter aporrectodeae TaxID=1110389 RepID=UPI002243785A|nr:multidrug effflux MFS transporter [Verminephrobacter aporrectodeae]MCW8163519.1 MFS transporter [Verminephrobacter aporrectodeae subsp. tuberculatae]MCW8167760.1 MFS transporter [Verminephrobacter aporrectodeae subsp. tuberculatae]
MTDTPLTPPSSPQSEKPWYANFLAFLIIALAPIGQMAIDIFVPSLPLMASEFAVDRTTVQWSVTLYLVAFAAGQLIYGPVSDSFGRRRALISGILLFLCGSAISILAQTITWFVVGRVVQGIGVTAASVLMRAIAADRFQGPKLAQVLTYMVIAWGVGPVIAPVLGATFQTSVGWRYSLVFLAVYAVVLLGLVVGVMKETNRRLLPLSASTIARGVVEIYGTLRFILIFLAMGLCYGALLSFNLVAPFMVQTVMGYGPQGFGAVALVLGAVYFGGVFSNRLLARSITTARKFALASALALVAAVIQVTLAIGFDLRLWALVLPFACVVFFSGVMYPNLMALGVSAFPHLAGLASSLLGFSLMLISAGVMGISSLLDVHSLIPFAWLTLALMGAVFALVRFIRP